MPERNRTTKVTLLAVVNGYIAGMDAAARKTGEFADGSAAKLAVTRAAMESVGRTMIAVGTVVAAGVAVAIARFAEFDQAMSNVKAVTQETAENMDLLRDAALDAGARTVFSATEAANAIEELGKNGLSTKDILAGGLDGALELAASGQLSVARAAEIAAVTMKQFGLEGSKIPHVSDLLAAGAGKAAGDVEDLAQALAQSGLVAKQTGLTIEETTGVLAAFADAGLMGSDAGTSLKTALQRLTPISKESKDEMTRLGISAYDAQGRFIGAAQFAGNLQNSLKDLSAEQRNAALAQIFGSDAVRAATVLYEQGAEGIQRYIDQTDDSGYAARQAAERLDNLRGDLEKLGGSIDTVLIKQGSAANDVLRAFVQSANFVVDAIGAVPEPVLAAGLAVGAIGAAILIAGGAAFTMVPKFAAFKQALIELKIIGPEVDGSLGKVAGSVSKVGGAIGVALVIFGAFLAEQAASKARVDAFAESLDQATGAVTKYTRELVVKKLQEKGAFDDAANYGISQRELTDAVLDGGKALEEVNKKLYATSEGMIGAQARAEGLQSRYSTTSTAIRTTREELEASQEAWDNTRAATDDNSDALAGLSGAATSAYDDINELADAIRGFGSVQFDLRDANRKVEESVDDFAASLEKNGATLDITTEQGRNNQAALDAIAKSYLEAAAATAIQTGSMDAALPVLESGRQAFIDAAVAAGYGADEASHLADELGLIPENVKTVVEANTDTAVENVRNLIDILRQVPTSTTIGFGTVLRAGGNENGGWYNQGVRAFENGGFPSGIYPGRPGGIHKFAEQKLPWETYISPKPGHERENIGYALESLARLGFRMPSSDASTPADQSRAQSQFARPDAGPTVIARESVEALGDVIARNTRQQNRTGGPVAHG